MDGIHFFRGKDRENKITIMVRQNETSRFEPWIAGLVLIIAASSTNICILISNFMSVLSWSALVSLTLAPLGVDLRFVGSEIKTKRPFCFVFRSLIRTFGFRPKLLTFGFPQIKLVNLSLIRTFAHDFNKHVDRFGLLATTEKNAKRKDLLGTGTTGL